MSDTTLPLTASFHVANIMEQVERVKKAILDLMQMFSHTEGVAFKVELALEEALVNAVKHGNKLDETKQVLIECILSHKSVRFEIEDQGEGFNPHELPDPTEEENIERPCGRGVLLIRSFMDSVQYNERGNKITFEKACETATAAA